MTGIFARVKTWMPTAIHPLQSNWAAAYLETFTAIAKKFTAFGAGPSQITVT